MANPNPDQSNLARWPKGVCPANDAGRGLASMAARRCAGTRRDGNPCRKVAVGAGTLCTLHGGIGQAVRAGTATPAQQARYAYNKQCGRAYRALRSLGVPPELAGTRAWKDTRDLTKGRKLTAQAALAVAWHARDAGDPRPWLDLISGRNMETT